MLSSSKPAGTRGGTMSNRKLASLLLGAVLASSGGIAAQAETATPQSVGLSSERLQRVHELVERNIAAGEIAGAVTLVARNGQVAYLEAQGVMDLQSKRPMQPDSMFRLASMTKPVVAVAILMLAEEGKVRLNDPVSRFIPSYANLAVGIEKPAAPGAGGGRPAGSPPDFYTVPPTRPITVLDLLTHTSGLMSGPMGNTVANAPFSRRHALGLQWVDELGASALEFQPGTRWAYSAVGGFDALARIVEIASGQEYGEFLAERLFGPLGMQDITFWPSAEQRSRLATVYQRRDGALVASDNPDSMSGERYHGGGGGLMATAETYAQFAMMLANGGERNGVRILSPRTVELMGSEFIPATLPGRQPGEGYGLGVRVVTNAAARGTWLSEGSFGWSGVYGTHFWVDPKENLVGILLAQTSSRALLADFENAVLQAVVD
jgi:CubicO group peptidase (beta-lactamase class C family)